MIRTVPELRRAVAAGGKVELSPGMTFDLGDDGLILPPTVTILGNRSTILRSSKPGSPQNAIWCDAPRGIVIADLTLQDPNAPRPFRNSSAGMNGLTLWSKSDTHSGNVLLENVTAVGMLSLLRVGGPVNRVRGIRVRNCRAVQCYYGLEFQTNGDDVLTDGLLCENVKRPYIGYGVDGHDLRNMTVSGDGDFESQTTVFLVKCYGQATRGIRIHATVRGKLTGLQQVVCCEFEGAPTMTGRITDVHADVRLEPALRNVKPLAFRSLHTQPDGRLLEDQTFASRTLDRITWSAQV